MEKISSFTLGVSLDTLRAGFEQGKVADVLIDPLQALLPRLTKAANRAPTSVYLFSNDEYAATRNFFGYALMHALQQQIPSALLVDCGFMEIGMNGVIPQQDALGFLDLLLYGSSLGVITQQTVGGVNVVGAGSFPVTKKMPFVQKAFDEASRRLVGHSRCAVFCGPLTDDSGDLHPLIGAVDLPLLVRGAGTAAAVDPIEEQITSQFETELISVRISHDETAAVQPQAAPAAPTVPVTESVAPEIVEPVKETSRFDEIAPPPVTTFPEAEKPTIDPPAREEVQERPAATSNARPTITPEQSSTAGQSSTTRQDTQSVPPPQEAVTIELGEGSALQRERRYSSLLPKVATGIIAVLVIVFIVWWLSEERGDSAETDPQSPAEVVQTTPATATQDDATTDPGSDGGSTDSGADGQEQAISEPPAEIPEATTQPPADTETGGTTDPGPTETAGESAGNAGSEAIPGARIDSRDIIVMDDLVADYSGAYLIHISSFRESAKARNEITYLEGKGFPVFVVFLDLGSKGTWYRVYAGPVDTRDNARNLKKLLDDTPRVRFTRITRVSGSS